MTEFIIPHGETAEHYFFKPYEGICMRTRTRGGLWQERVSVADDAKNIFAVYSSADGAMHVIYVSAENNLVYTVRKKGMWKSYILSSLNEEVFIFKMRLYTVGNRLNLLYSALYNGENLLIHCILGDRAKPSAIAVMNSSEFYIFQNLVYYTNTHGELVKTDLSDEKPTGFEKLYDNASYCCIRRFGDEEVILFLRGEKLYVNGAEILYDSRIEMPVCVQNAGRLYIMWKSGGFVRYITSNSGTWSEPARFMNTGDAVTLYTIQNGKSFFDCYGFRNAKDITLYGKPDFFNQTDTLPGTVEKLKTMLDDTRRELADAKAETARLAELLSGK